MVVEVTQAVVGTEVSDLAVAITVIAGLSVVSLVAVVRADWQQQAEKMRGLNNLEGCTRKETDQLTSYESRSDNTSILTTLDITSLCLPTSPV